MCIRDRIISLGYPRMICDLDKNDNSILTIKSKFLTITECHLQLGLTRHFLDFAWYCVDFTPAPWVKKRYKFRCFKQGNNKKTISTLFLNNNLIYRKIIKPRFLKYPLKQKI